MGQLLSLAQEALLLVGKREIHGALLIFWIFWSFAHAKSRPQINAIDVARLGLAVRPYNPTSSIASCSNPDCSPNPARRLQRTVPPFGLDNSG
jgi:hypothetical protein